MSNDKNILTVSELTQRIQFSLETTFPRVWVQGEISNFKYHTSGHMYFTLKDEGAQLSAVLWRSRVPSLACKPEDGMMVVVRGSITVYPPRGSYQLDVDQLQPVGVGDLQLRFEMLKKKLAAEGLFDSKYKKPIPRYPQRIGIITSETGAALRDMLHVLSRRNPMVEILFYPVRVQGEGAAEEIAEAIKACNEYGDIDVLIVGRGGGSIEDLWAFNEEIVARAIFASKIPVISAVGHEIDFSIADFVADLRAPTPSAAAELVVRDKNEIIAEIANFCYTMEKLITMQVESLKDRIRYAVRSYSFNKPRDLVRQYFQQHDELVRALERSVVNLYQLYKQRVYAVKNQFVALDPQRVLQRGYAIIRKEGKIVSSKKQLAVQDTVHIQFNDGIVETTVERVS